MRSGEVKAWRCAVLGGQKGQSWTVRNDLTLLAPTTKLWATLAMKPSTWTPRSLHKIRRRDRSMNQQSLTATQLSKTSDADTGTNQSNQLRKDKMSNILHFGKLDDHRLKKITHKVRQKKNKQFNLLWPLNGRYTPRWFSFGCVSAGIQRRTYCVFKADRRQ